jgi:hypothetical protein
MDGSDAARVKITGLLRPRSTARHAPGQIDLVMKPGNPKRHAWDCQTNEYSELPSPSVVSAPWVRSTDLVSSLQNATTSRIASDFIWAQPRISSTWVR